MIIQLALLVEEAFLGKGVLNGADEVVKTGRFVKDLHLALHHHGSVVNHGRAGLADGVSFAFPIPLGHLHKQGSGGVEHLVFTASSLYARVLSPSDFSHVPVFQKTHPLLRW